jgi:hypothetical protein
MIAIKGLIWAHVHSYFMLGKRLLRTMGWIEGQAVGARRKRHIVEGINWIRNGYSNSGIIICF